MVLGERECGRMRAVIHDRYGPPEVLRVAELERPALKDDEVLVSVHASTVTRGDTMGVRSVEYRFTRVFTGIRRPRRTSLVPMHISLYSMPRPSRPSFRTRMHGRSGIGARRRSSCSSSMVSSGWWIGLA